MGMKTDLGNNKTADMNADAAVNNATLNTVANVNTDATVNTSSAPGDSSMVLKGLSTMFDGLRIMFAGIAGQADIAGQVNVASASMREVCKAAKSASIASDGNLTKETSEKDMTSFDEEQDPVAVPVENAKSPDTVQATSTSQPKETESNVQSSEPVQTSEHVQSSEALKSADSIQSSQSAITLNMLTKVIVSKIKQDRNNSDRINKLVNTYGVRQLSELPESKYEALLSDISEL